MCLCFSSQVVGLTADGLHFVPVDAERLAINSASLNVVGQIVGFVGFCRLFSAVRLCIIERKVSFSVRCCLKNFRVVPSAIPPASFDIAGFYRFFFAPPIMEPSLLPPILVLALPEPRLLTVAPPLVLKWFNFGHVPVKFRRAFAIPQNTAWL